MDANIYTHSHTHPAPLQSISSHITPGGTNTWTHTSNLALFAHAHTQEKTQEQTHSSTYFSKSERKSRLSPLLPQLPGTNFLSNLMPRQATSSPPYLQKYPRGTHPPARAASAQDSETRQPYFAPSTYHCLHRPLCSLSPTPTHATRLNFRRNPTPFPLAKTHRLSGPYRPRLRA